MEKKYTYEYKILPQKLEEQFVAFLDVMGFSNMVFQNNIEQLDRYFFYVNKILQDLKEKDPKINFVAISDSIIIVSPSGKQGLTLIIKAIKEIQITLLRRKILLRGALSFGQVYFDNDNNILFGKGYIKAYKLEGLAIFPRVIIDPYIISLNNVDRASFIKQYNVTERLIYDNNSSSLLKDDAIFIDYGKILDEDNKIHQTIASVYDMIRNNLYNDQSIFEKYIWIKNYYLENLLKINTKDLHYNTKRAIDEWIIKFKRL